MKKIFKSTLFVIAAVVISAVYLTISMFVLMINNLKDVDIMQKEQAQIEDIEKWNQEWEVYNKENMYGAEVLTVLNKAENIRKDGYNFDIRVDEYLLSEKELNNDIESFRTYLNENNHNIFKCESNNIGYSTEGYINFMEFKKT